MNWALRRKVLYGSVGVIIVLIVALWGWRTFLYKTPSCFDGTKDGTELGIDCGGACSRVCAEEAHAPIVAWTRALKVSTSTYTAAAYVQNLNGSEGAHAVPYAIRLFDAQNLLIVERDGVADIPPQQTVPIIENNIDVGDRTVARAFLEFSGDATWQKIPQDEIPSLRVKDITIAPDARRVSATIVNNGNNEIRNLAVDAVLFDADDTAQAASKSVIERLAPGDSQQVVFTWPSPRTDIVRADITPVPSVEE